MKKILLLLLLTIISQNLVAQVGIGTSNPNANAILDLTATNKALLLPRVANTAAIPAPVNGMMIFDLSSNCAKVFENGAWSVCLSSVSTQNLPTINVNCEANGFVGSYIQGFPLSSSSFSVTVTNNSFSTATFSIAPTDLELTGANAGITVSSVSFTLGGANQTTVTLIAGATQILHYNLTGTPTTSGSLSATWSKLTLSCVGSSNVGTLADFVNPNFCTNATINGFFASSFAMQASNTFAITITNTSTSSLNLPNPAIANLSLSYSGTASPAFTVSGATGSATGVLAAGASRTFTYTLAGTPTSVGTLTLNWSYGGLTCTRTRLIDAGQSNFNANYCTSAALNGPNYVSGVTFTGKSFVITITNTSGVATPALPAPVAANLTFGFTGTSSPAFSVASATQSTSGVLAVGASRTFTYNLAGTPTSVGTFTANWSYLGMTCSVSRAITLGDATFTTPIAASVASVFQVSPPVDIQGIMNNTTNRLTVNMPYTGGIGTYIAYTSPWFPVVGESGDTNNIRYSYPAGTFATTGNILLTFEVDGDGLFNVKKQAPGATELITAANFVINGNVSGLVNVNAVGTSRPFRTGTYSSRNASDALAVFGSCAQPTAANIANDVFTNSWGSPSSSAGYRLQVDFGSPITIDKVVISGGCPGSCWGGCTSSYPIDSSLVLEYFNGTTWLSTGATVPTINTDSVLTTINLPTIINTSRLRLRETTGGWVVVGNFYPMAFF
jgi:hypothetical protein